MQKDYDKRKDARHADCGIRSRVFCCFTRATGFCSTVGSIDIIDESILSSDIKNGEVKTADLGGNSVTAAKIKDGEVKAAEIATDSIGAEELKGVTKLVLASCPISLTNFGAGNVGSITCSVPASQVGDRVVTTLNADTTATGRHCMVPTSSFATDGSVVVRYRNECDSALTTAFSAEMIIFMS